MHPIVHLFGLELYAYNLFSALGLLFALIAALLLCKKLQVKPYKVLSVMLVCLISGFVGAFVTYVCVTYSINELLAAIKSDSFAGGFVYYGGVFFAVIASFGFIRALKWNFDEIEHVLVPCLPLSHALGRVGCFMAGCCYGKESDSGISVLLPNLNKSVLPVQLFEAAGELIICLGLLCTLKKRGALRRYLLLYAPLRFVIEFFRGDAVRGGFLWFSTSQWLSIAVVLCIFVSMRVKKIRSY